MDKFNNKDPHENEDDYESQAMKGGWLKEIKSKGGSTTLRRWRTSFTS